MLYFHKVRRLEHKISKLPIMEIYERLDMLNKSHPLCRYEANSGKNKGNCLMHFDTDDRAFVLSN